MMLLKSAWMIYKQDKQQTLNILCIFLRCHDIDNWCNRLGPRKIRLNISYKSRTFSLYALDKI
jgi:hypothetical protein